jgi:alkanesulfonate monooxygenase SsuD/methylene tetrahydromethanopterin reductase-like flavin-dependent oxidoreductase (luciferase family)
MKFGVGLPNPVPGVSGSAILEYARRAERFGFDSVATIDRLVFPSYDTLATLAAVGGATSRIGLLSNILIAPLYQPEWLAKSAASIDQLTGGRLTLGLAAGGRGDDFTVLGLDPTRRGRAFDRGLDLMHRAWQGERFGDGEPITPTPTKDDRVPILIGGANDATIGRIVKWGAGWTFAAGGPEQGAPFAQQVRAAWQEAGRAGEPRVAALTYFGLGDDVTGETDAYLRHYYTFLGPYVDQILGGVLRTPDAIRQAVRAYTDAGFNEINFHATSASPDQVDRLAEVVLG